MACQNELKAKPTIYFEEEKKKTIFKLFKNTALDCKLKASNMFWTEPNA